MSAIFVSHRSSDDAEAQALKDWLSQQGHEQLFLDFDPADGIPAGVDWEQRLYQELRRCQALLIVLTPAWLESKWCGSELAIAREKGKAVFVVRVKPCTDGPLIPAIQEVDLTVDREAALEKLARGLKEHGLDPRDAFDWKPDRPVYPGLAAFDVDDAAIFFGRSEESWQVVEALRRMRLQAAGAPKLLLITGASGSGKSSLMRAGVLARLRKEPASWITARPFRRGADALGGLAEALAWAFPPARRPTSLEAILSRLTGPDGVGQLLTIAQELRLALDRSDAALVLPLDQAEELLVAERGDDASKLLDLFRETLGAVGNEILVIATIRSDRLGAWQQHGSIKATADHGELAFEMLPLGPMPMARIGDIVRGPAAYEGLRVDDDLVDAIRADTVTPDALPLLAYTLQYLHRHFAQDGRLTLAEYQSFGGLEGSVRSQADAAIPIDRLSEVDRRALQEAFVPGLVRATAQGGFSRSRALFATLPRRAEPYLRRLVDVARLLTTDRDPKGNETVEVTHESLLRIWPTLARWIVEDAERLRRLEAIQRAAQDWARGGRGEDFLVHRDQRLSDAESLIAERRFAAQLGNCDSDYLAACRNAQSQREAGEREAQERELRTTRELANRRRTQVRGAITAALLLFVFAAVAASQWLEARSTLHRANQAMASALWNRLDFNSESLSADEREALWELRLSQPGVRQAFLAKLKEDSERRNQLARYPDPILRALALRWPSEDADVALDFLLDGITSTTDPDRIEVLAESAHALATKLAAEQAQNAILEKIKTTTNADQLKALTETAKALKEVPQQTRISKFMAELAQMSIMQVLESIKSTRTTDDQLEALSEKAQALIPELTAEDAREALEQVLTLIARAADNGLQEPLNETAQALAGKLTAEQAEATVGQVIDRIPSTINSDQLETLSEMAQVLAGKLTAEQAEATVGQVIDWIPSIVNSDQLEALAIVTSTLAAKLTSEQAQVLFGSSLDTIKRMTSPGQLDPLTEALVVLAGKLDTSQAQLELGPILESINGASDSWELQAAAQALRVLPVSVDLGQLKSIITPLNKALNSASGGEKLIVAADATQAIAQRLPSELAGEVIRTLLGRIEASTDRKELEGLTIAAQRVAYRLNPDEAEQALARALRLLSIERQPVSVKHLNSVIRALSFQFWDQDAQGVFSALVTAITAKVDEGKIYELISIIDDLSIGDDVGTSIRPWVESISELIDTEIVDSLLDRSTLIASQILGAQPLKEVEPILDAISPSIKPKQVRDLSGRIEEVYLLPSIAAPVDHLVTALLESIWPPRSALASRLALISALDLRRELQHTSGGQFQGNSGDTAAGLILKASVRAIETENLVMILSKLKSLPTQPASDHALRIQNLLMDLIKHSTLPMGVAYLIQVSSDLNLPRNELTSAMTLTPEQAEATFYLLLDGMKSTADLDELEVLADGAQALATKLTADQAQAMLGQVLDQFPSGHPRLPIVTVVDALASKLTTEQAQAVGEQVTDRIRGKTEPGPRWLLLTVLGALAPKLTVEQAQAALALSLDGLRSTTEPNQVRERAGEVEALAGKLAAEQVQAALDLLLDGIRNTTDYGQRTAHVDVAQLLAPRLAAQPAFGSILVALGAILDVMPTDLYQQREVAVAVAFAEVAEAFAPKLSTEQAQPALDAILAWLAPIPEAVRSNPGWIDVWKVLADLAEALAYRFAPEHAPAALRSILASLDNSLKSTDWDPRIQWQVAAATSGLAAGAAALAPKVIAEEAEDAFDSILTSLELALKALDSIGSAKVVVTELADGAAALVGKVGDEHAQAARTRALSLLGWSESTESATAVARTVGALWARERKAAFLAGIVETLKYPMAAGEPTATLLEALHQIVPEAPGEEAGLEANLDWIESIVEIDLDGPPTCPPPPQKELACPRPE